MKSNKGIIEYFVGWEVIPFGHRVLSIPLVPSIFLLAVALLPIVAVLEGLQYLLSGKTPNIYDRYANFIVGRC